MDNINEWKLNTKQSYFIPWTQALQTAIQMSVLYYFISIFYIVNSQQKKQ